MNKVNLHLKGTNWAITIKEYLLCTIGCFISSFGWTAFLIPKGIVGGGVTGIATIIDYATKGTIPMFVSFAILNFFLLIIGSIILGKGFGFKTIYMIILMSIFFKILPSLWTSNLNDQLMNAIIGGALSGIGIGTIFLQGGSTGGMDIVILIITKYKQIATGRLFFFFDWLITSSMIFLPDKAFTDVVYGYVEIFFCAQVIDMVLNGVRQSVQVIIFSKEYDTLATRISTELERGVTMLNTTGWYSKQENHGIMVICRKIEINKLTKIIKSIDPYAFHTITPTSAVYGLGFDLDKDAIMRKEKKAIVSKD